MAECANNGCVAATAVVVQFVDPDEVESYCLNCGVHKFRRNSTAVGVAEEDSDLGEVIEDWEFEDGSLRYTGEHTHPVSHPEHSQSLGVPDLGDEVAAEVEFDAETGEDRHIEPHTHPVGNRESTIEVQISGDGSSIANPGEK